MSITNQLASSMTEVMASSATATTFGVFSIAILALIWKYSDLPEIDWSWAIPGIMLLLTSGFLSIFLVSLSTFVDNVGWLSQIIHLVRIGGASLLIFGSVKKAIDYI